MRKMRDRIDDAAARDHDHFTRCITTMLMLWVQVQLLMAA
jgi:hypothetical protein